MSSPAFDAPLTLEVRPSRALRAAVLLLHALAAAGLLALPVVWLIAGAAALMVSITFEWQLSARHHRLYWRVDGAWECPGAVGDCALHAFSFVSPWLVVLALDDGRRIRRWVLVRDALPAATWRRLRARLRVAGPALTGERA